MSILHRQVSQGMIAASLFFSIHSSLSQNITLAGQAHTLPVWIRAHNNGCDGDAPLAFAYTVDTSADLRFGVTAYDIDTTDPSITPGPHTVHYWSWTRTGLCPVEDDIINAGAAPNAKTEPQPSNAIVASGLETLNSWQWQHDPATPGASVGTSWFPRSIESGAGQARQFDVSFSRWGGELFHVTFGQDFTSSHFLYDTYVRLADPALVENIEMDINHVLPSGSTVILGIQCASGSGTWEFTNVQNDATQWHPSNIPCQPHAWLPNVSRHVQIASHHDSSGNVTYDWVALDGVVSYFKAAGGPSSLDLGWPTGDLLLNFQLDGSTLGQGTITAFLNNLTISRW